MTNKNWGAVFEDLGYWIKSHWFFCLVLLGFFLIWRTSGTTFRDGLTGNIYPALLLLIPLLVTFLLSFLVIIYSDMST